LLFTGALLLAGVAALVAVDRAAERRLLTLRASQLSAQALAPGSPLACLHTVAGEALQPSCEKALFGNAEVTAAALSYVDMQLSLLRAARQLHASGGGLADALSYVGTRFSLLKTGDQSQASGEVLADVRRAVEIDRFGFVAHVLATSYGCTPKACESLKLLEDPRQVRANLAGGQFAAHAKKHILEPTMSTAAAQPPTPPAPAPKPSSNLYVPSAASIPPISIMTAEPELRKEPEARKEVSEATATNTPRKPGAGKEPTRAAGGVNSGGSPGQPLQISPEAQ
jgi:hypothetical protein